MKRRMIALLMCLTMVVSLAACGGDTKECEDNLTDKNTETEFPGDSGDEIVTKDDVYYIDKANAAAIDFAVRLFQEDVKSQIVSDSETPGARDQNKLISPISVLMALAMTTNGADGETLQQMERVLGMEIGQLNAFSSEYLINLTEELKIANSIWLREDARVTLEDAFGHANKTYYGADVYKRPFDQSTVDEINGWINEKTDGMIKKIIREIPEESILYLINALCFEADWEVPYVENQLKKEIFTTSWGETQEVEMMYSMEDFYLEDEKAIGVMKHYMGRKYAFVALLPKEGVSIGEYAEYLSGEHLQELLANPQDCRVQTWIPPFEQDYEVEMSELLKNMGITDAFDVDSADFSNLGSCENGNIFISSVLHKTFIEVSLEGTKAGAVSGVDMAVGAVSQDTRPLKEVKLDRPFIYMIIDCETNQPIFMGTVNRVDA